MFCVYYESLKRALKTKTIYGYRCDARLKTNVEESTRLACTPLCADIEWPVVTSKFPDTVPSFTKTSILEILVIVITRKNLSSPLNRNPKGSRYTISVD